MHLQSFRNLLLHTNSADEAYLFVALEEGLFYQKDYGSWLPSALYECQSDEVEIKINKLTRSGSKINYKYSLRASGGRGYERFGSFSDATKVDSSSLDVTQDIECVYSMSDDWYCIEIPVLNRTGYGANNRPTRGVRRIMFRFFETPEQIIKSISVSKACAGFQWDVFIKNRTPIKAPDETLR